MILTKKYLKDYTRSSKKQKSIILASYCILTKVTRETAKQRFSRASKKKKFFVQKVQNHRGRKKIYVEIHKQLIKKVWELSGQICAERLLVLIPEYIECLKKVNDIECFSNDDVTKCLEISMGSLKRIIDEFPKPQHRKNRAKSPLLNKIPIDANFRRYAYTPGNVEIDYVEHNGGNSSGIFGITGTYVELFSQWVVRVAGLGKNQTNIARIHEEHKKRIYHKEKRFHTDNCPTILTHLLETVIKKHRLPSDTVTRSRPYCKNDNAHVEQKNGDKVRNLVGYHRYDTQEAISLLNDIYAVEDLISNFFVSSVKIWTKITNKEGKVIKKVYTKARTPYDRLMSSKQVDQVTKEKLMDVKSKLNIVELRRKSDELIGKLERYRSPVG